MAQNPNSLLPFLKRFPSQNPNPNLTLSLVLSHLLSRPFSTTPSATPAATTSSTPKPSSLSSRLSFVFDQIDQIEKERQSFQHKDQVLQRIRAWRESKAPSTDSAAEPDEEHKPEPENGRRELGAGVVELAHPWKEWVELMERLLQQNYFDHRRRDEDGLVDSLGVGNVKEVADDLGFDFTRDWKTVQTACLNFGRDRFDILRSLSSKDIQNLVGYGCPSADRKVVFSAKLLRKLVHLDEGDVCSSCSLRNSCEKAYLLTNKEDETRTIDVMRVLLTFGFDPVNGSVTNKSLLKNKSVKNVVRKLLHEVVKLSAVPIDPNLPPPVIKRPPPKVKQPPPPPKKRVGRDDIEMKKGDWLCPKCDFMNFAKNTVCLQCDAKRPKRQLLPGEWECPECNFLNYRRNMACFHCEHKRPPDEFMENQRQERERGPRTRLEKVASRTEVSNAFNFNFDDDESDGADVAAFECADSPRMGQDTPFHERAEGGDFRGPDEDFNRGDRRPVGRERQYEDPDVGRPRMGFDDFDDEDDDVDSYELDTPSSNPPQKTSSIDFSELEEYSGSEDIEGFDENFPGHHPTKSSKYNKSSRPIHRKATTSGIEDDELDLDSDDELSVNPKWKSSHVADSRQRGRGATGPSRGLSFGSDEELGLGSDTDDDLGEDFGSQSKKERWGSGRRDLRRGSSDTEDRHFSASGSDDDDTPSYRSGGNKTFPGERRNNSRGRGDFGTNGDSKFRSNSVRDGRRNSFNDDFDRSPRGFRGGNNGGGFRGHDYNSPRMSNRGGRNGGGFRGNDYNSPRMSNRGGDSHDFNGPRQRQRFGSGQGGRNNNFNNKSGRDRDFDDDRPRRQRFGSGQGGRNNNFSNRSGRDRAFDDDRPRSQRFGSGQGGRNNNFSNQSGRVRAFDDDRPRRQRIIER